MELRRVLPYVAALLLLAFALGSLARSQVGGGSLLLNSYWLLYAIYLLPIIVLAGLVAITIFAAYYWRDLSDAIGFGLAQRRKKRGKNKTLTFIITFCAWGLALGFLINTCNSSILSICRGKPTPASGYTVASIVGGNTSSPLPSFLGGVSVVIGNIVSSEWFAYVFFGLVVISSLIFLRAVKVSWEETRLEARNPRPMPNEEAIVAVNEAIKIVEDPETLDPRMRIIHCYQRMIRAAADFGAPVSEDQTARELELGIRRSLTLRGPAIRDLTQLFEEARYSLHTITYDDSGRAHYFLDSIAQELNHTTFQA